MCCIPVWIPTWHAASVPLTSPPVPHRSPWVTGIGLAFFFFNLCLFAMNTVLLSLRFYLRPQSFLTSFTDQFESLFISASVSSAFFVPVLLICS